MSHTDAQARELWCPLVRGAAADHPTTCRCIASECAMWRWVPSSTTHKEIEIRERATAQLIGPPTYQKYEVSVDVQDAPTHGYCGLAGRPEMAA